MMDENWKLLRRFRVSPITIVSINETSSLKALPRPNESLSHASSINDRNNSDTQKKVSLPTRECRSLENAIIHFTLQCEICEAWCNLMEAAAAWISHNVMLMRSEWWSWRSFELIFDLWFKLRGSAIILCCEIVCAKVNCILTFIIRLRDSPRLWDYEIGKKSAIKIE